MLTCLQRCSLKSDVAELAKYFFTNEEIGLCGDSHVRAQRCVSFGTLFGAFHVDSWRQHTDINRIGIRLTPSKQANVQIFKRSTGSSGVNGLISSEYDANSNIHWVDLSNETSGIIYPKIMLEAGSQKIDIELQLEILTDKVPLRDVRTAVIIPTYRRELQVSRNVKRISSRILQYLNAETQIVVVDNGSTLQKSDIVNIENVRLVTNRNLGGAGGFARGMLEVLDDGRFTHVIMCDDDADIEPESIIRAAIFFSFCKEDVYLGGTMLYEHDRSCVHESGACVDGPNGFRSNKQGRRVNNIDELAALDIREPTQYFGWYLVGYSIDTLRNQGLPQPFFIRFDDQEFGFRLLGRGVVPATIPSFCVWHEAFHLRDSQITHYYLARNGIISLLMHRKSYRGSTFARQFIREFFLALFTLRYDRASYILGGIRDALKGPEFLYHVDAEALNNNLLHRQVSKIATCPANSLDGLWFEVEEFRSEHRRHLKAILTLGGHLLPARMTRRKSFEYINSGRFDMTFDCQKIFFFEPLTRLGWIAERNRKRFFSLAVESFPLFLRLWLSASTLGESYREAQKGLSSSEHWRRQFERDVGRSV